MPLLQSCCFWNNVKTGSYASVVYTLVYFSFSSFILVVYVSEQREYLSGARERPLGESFLDRNDVSPTTVIFNILFLMCSIILVVASILAILALRYNKRELLIPWIIFMIGDVLIELAHIIFLALTQRVIFDPVVAFLFTIDFFITCLNFYCLLCVVSQYQEYQRQGRGCVRVQLTAPKIALQKRETDTLSAHEQFRLSGSPFLSMQLPTNTSTIHEENEKKCKSSCGTVDEMCLQASTKSKRSPSVSCTVEPDNHLQVPNF